MADRRTRILGQMLGQFVGKEAVVLGRVTKIGAGGKSIELTTFDNTKINITVPNTVEANPNDILEVWGTVKTKGTMVASQCVLFDAERCQDFDQKLYNDFVIMQHAVSDRKWRINSSREGLH